MKVFHLTKSEPLSNPFKIGDVDFWVHDIIKNDEDVLAAYRRFIDSQIRLKNIIVIKTLDEIAWSVIDGQQVALTVVPAEASRPRNIGQVIVEIVSKAIKARCMDNNS